MKNSDVLRTCPAVFAMKDTYQIFVPVKKQCVMWVRVGNEQYYDHSNGILRSDTVLHKITVPQSELNAAKKYTVCYREMLERKAYFSETGEICEIEFEFRPALNKEIKAYHIADAHVRVETPVKACETFCKKYGEIDFLILNGDIPDKSETIENFDVIYDICAGVTKGNIPIVFSRGNHDTRGFSAEKFSDYTPCDNGKSYFTFRIGSLWGIVVDCGEDKRDTNEEYGNTVCCHAFRKEQTKHIENVIKNSENEYNAPDVAHKIVVSHVRFTRSYEFPFDIEEDTYTYWSKLLRENVKPDVMICGHEHILRVCEQGAEDDCFGQPCTVVVGAKPLKDKYYGAGFIFGEDGIKTVFTDSDGGVGEIINL